jgi:hypothetical protein
MRPSSSRCGRHLTAAGPGSIGPVRSLGPARSNRTGQRRPGPAGHAMQQAEDLVDVREDVGFGASERRQSDPGKPVLQSAHIVPAEPDVVNQIRGTGCVVRVHRPRRIAQTRLQCDEIRP